MTQEEVAILWKDANGWDVRGYKNTLEDLERFARLVAAKEREALANVATEDTSNKRVDEMQKQRHEQEPVTVLPDGSAFAVMSYPLPKDHWLYQERQYNNGEYEPVELGKPILTHEMRDAVVSAVRYAIRGATNCGKEVDFDPDALVQNAVYALCGPYTTPPQTDEFKCPLCYDDIANIKNPSQPEQEPVTWGVDWGKAGDIPCVSIIKRLPDGGIQVLAVEYAPYSYTTPPQRKPLTDEQIMANDVLRYHFALNGGDGPISKQGRKVIDAIEAAHGIKENT